MSCVELVEDAVICQRTVADCAPYGLPFAIESKYLVVVAVPAVIYDTEVDAVVVVPLFCLMKNEGFALTNETENIKIIARTSVITAVYLRFIVIICFVNLSQPHPPPPFKKPPRLLQE